MTKSKTISRPTTGGRFVRNKATGALTPVATQQADAAEAASPTDAVAETTAGKKEGP
ncbi:hypothetical protein ABEB22_18320 (plasmid) [Thioclava sp. 'Guangxiensis']|uniref:hypothetical protein n=1 Tax=Thioclava sp. 'Guangxiensis' TaxID=3149044 RepID=UPI0032C404C5